MCKDMNCFRCRSYGPIRVFFSSLLQLGIRRPLWPFSVAPPIQALRGFPCLGSFSVVWVRCFRHIEGAPLAGFLLCRLARQALKGAPWVESYSIVPHVMCLMAQPLLFSCPMWTCGDGESMVMAPPPMHDSAVSPCFHGCLAFLHRHFPPQSPPSCPFGPSFCTQQQPSSQDVSTRCAF